MIDQAIGELTPRKRDGGVWRRWVSHARSLSAPSTEPASTAPTRAPRPQPRALSQVERSEVLGVLHAERFVDQAPGVSMPRCWMKAATCARCQPCTACCALRARSVSGGGRRRIRRQSSRASGHLPDQIWSWDITKFQGPEKWTYFHLYVIIDIFSRYVVGWLLATRETAALAERLLAETIRKHNVAADQLTIHADRGTSMASKPVALLLADLGVTKSHSRPHCSNDNPYSEAQFKIRKIPTRVPGPFRLPRRWPRVLQTVLPLVQPRPPPFWHRLPYTSRRSFRTR